MTDEHALYLSDRAAWAKLVAPRWAAMLAAADDARKRELWKIACPELRAAIRAQANALLSGQRPNDSD